MFLFFCEACHFVLISRKRNFVAREEVVCDAAGCCRASANKVAGGASASTY